MIRRIATAAALLALTTPASLAAAAPAGDPGPARLLVTGREYSLTLSRAKLRGGDAIIQLHNFGEDPHDLHLQRAGTDRVFAIGEVEPGETGTLELRLRRRSTYRLWCSIDPHAALGMETTLRTKAKRPPRRR
jgi:plastocyanin